MKSEHRHDLKTNELGRLVGEATRASEQYVHQHVATIVIAAIALIAVVLGVWFWISGLGSTGSESWRSLSGANSVEDFARAADKYRGTSVASWARLREAEAELFNGTRLMFTDRDAGRSELRKAQEAFEEVVADKNATDEIQERALYGLATTREALSDKNTEPAIQTYQRLLTQFPNTVYKPLAEARIAALKTGRAQDFYAWFHVQNPQPRDRELPQDLAIPPAPGDAKSQPDPFGPDLPLPSAPEAPARSDAPAKSGATPKPDAASPASQSPAPGSPSK
jgi:hypothetical protein